MNVFDEVEFFEILGRVVDLTSRQTAHENIFLHEKMAGVIG